VTALLSLGLLLAGGVLLWLAAVTPWHSNSEAYFAELAALRAHLYMREPGMADFKAAMPPSWRCRPSTPRTSGSMPTWPMPA
jgi:hypothetical protein